MRLLYTADDGRLGWTDDLVGDQIPPYAILSHTWEGQEVPYKDLQNHKDIGDVDTRLRGGYQKIFFCAAQAKHDGLDYFWVDTCCIDKANNTELSEAINSMFRWYQKAKKCYVYLSDVECSTSTGDKESSRRWKPAFRQSRWFTRGWTLQELLAPASVAFFSKEGELLGSKQSLKDTIHEITGIPSEALLGKQVSEFSVAERFSWAQNRQTTRDEDGAYCLFGMFGCHLPLIYGEGKAKALHRLRREIEAASEDIRGTSSSATRTQMQRQLRREDYTVGWVCALPVERAAAQAMLDEEHAYAARESSDNDDNVYCLGSVAGHNVVIVCLPAGCIGNNPAAAVATQMRAAFKGIRFGLMVGIGGGVPSAEVDIRLGDVVVSQPQWSFGGVVQYDFGRRTPSGLERIGSLNAPPQILLSAVSNIQANKMVGKNTLPDHLSTLERYPAFQRRRAGPDLLFEAAYNHEHGATCDQCSAESRQPRTEREGGAAVTVHYGTIASGNQVMKDAAERDRVSAELGGVLCFEMEAAGLMNSFPCLVIRGISDYADTHKNKQWQAYAAGTAAAYAKELLSAIPPTEVISAPRADDKRYLPSLIRAAASGDLANVKDLLKRGTETNITDSQGRTCLFKAVNARRTAVVEELLAYEADVNILDNEGWSPLHDATSEGLAEIVAMLLNAGASVHQRDKKGWPALHWAAYRGFGTIAGHLIKAGADPNCISWTDGWTALHFAACWRHRDVIEVLINGGADVNKASRLRKTPLDVAEDPEVMIPQDEGTVRLLKNYGGQNYQLIDNYGSHDNTRHPTQEGLDDPSTLTSDSESEGT